MYPVSAAFIAAIESGSYQIANKVDVDPGNGIVAATFRCESGSFTVDRGSTNRRSCSLTLTMSADEDPDGIYSTGADYVPESAGDLLTPYGTMFRPYSGIVLPDGNGNDVGPGGIEWVPMGVFVLTDSEFDVSGAGDVVGDLTGYDQSWLIDDLGFTAPFAITSSNPVTAVQSILNATKANIPALIMDPTSLTIPTPLPTYNEGDAPWSSIMTILDSIGYEGAFDVAGTPVARPTPDPSGVSAGWTFTDGPQGVTSAKRKWTRTGVSNDFTVTSSSSAVQPPVRGSARDTNPNSPTCVFGRFGDIPTFQQNALVGSSSAATAAAEQLLAVSLGESEVLSWTCLPNPAWDVDDVAAQTIGKLGVAGAFYVVDTVNHVFDAKSDTTITARRVTT